MAPKSGLRPDRIRCSNPVADEVQRLDISPKPRDQEKGRPAEAEGHQVTAPSDCPREESAPFAIEFCSGTGGLTAQLRKLGMTASFGVDRIVKGSSKAPIVKIDLGSKDGEELAASWIHNKQCKYCHFGLPCGTSSRAREIPMSSKHHGPQPLRSDSFPDGLPKLAPKDRERLDLANKVCRLILLCHQLGVHWSVQQPARSIFWLTSFWKAILAVVTPWIVTFHSCMFGGMRPKKTSIVTWNACRRSLLSVPTNMYTCHGELHPGVRNCGRGGVPLELCKRWAQLVYDFIQPEYTQPRTALPAHPDKKARALAHNQTKKSLAFIPEWSHVVVQVLFQPPPFVVGNKLKNDVVIDNVSFPANARILRTTHKPIDKKGEERQSLEIAIGAPWIVESFIQEAMDRGHPASLFDGLASGVRQAIQQNVKKDPAEIAKLRASFLRKWTTRAVQLEAEEKVLHDGLPKHRQKILQGKGLLVLKEMLDEMHFPDRNLVDDIVNGFDLVGTAGAEGLLPPDFQPAALSIADLEEGVQEQQGNCELLQVEWHGECGRRTLEENHGGGGQGMARAATRGSQRWRARLSKICRPPVGQGPADRRLQRVSGQRWGHHYQQMHSGQCRHHSSHRVRVHESPASSQAADAPGWPQLRPQERLPPTCSVRLITEVGQTGSVRSGRKEDQVFSAIQLARWSKEQCGSFS